MLTPIYATVLCNTFDNVLPDFKGVYGLPYVKRYLLLPAIAPDSLVTALDEVESKINSLETSRETKEAELKLFNRNKEHLLHLANLFKGTKLSPEDAALKLKEFIKLNN